MKRMDELWKGALDDTMKDFILFMEPNAAELFDFDRGIEMLDKELQQLFKPEDGFVSSNVTDKLAKLYTKDGQEQYVLVHVEVQDEYRSIFGERMFRYFYLIYGKHRRPITAYAILTEPNRKDRPDTFKLSFMGTELTYRFNVLKIAQLDDQALMASKNIFAWVALFAKASFVAMHIKDADAYDEQLMALKLKLYRHLLGNDFDKSQVAVLEDFLTYYVNFNNPKNNRKFELAKQEIAGGNDTMGIREMLLANAEHKGIEKGIEKGEAKERAKAYADKLRSAAKMKKSGFDNAMIADVLDLPIEEVEKL